MITSENRFLVFNKRQWQDERDARVFGFNWTDEEIDKAKDGDGLIGTKFGVDCYVTKMLPTK